MFLCQFNHLFDVPHLEQKIKIFNLQKKPTESVLEQNKNLLIFSKRSP